MQSFIRRQIASFITPQTNLPLNKKIGHNSFSTPSKKQEQVGENLTAHQFDPAINFIFRPQRFVRPNKSTRTNPLTDRNPTQQKQKQKKEAKSFSVQKSLSLLKKIKDFIVPQKSIFNFKINANEQRIEDENLNLSINSKKNDQRQKASSYQEDKLIKQPKQDLVAMKKISGLSNTSHDSVIFVIPQLKISLPKQSSKQDDSKQQRSSVVIQDDNLNGSNYLGSRKNSLINSVLSSKSSQKSQKSQRPKFPLSQSLSQIVKQKFHKLKSQHIEGQKLKYFYILGHTLTSISTTIYVLIGNENQIDCLCISKMSSQEIVDIDSVWSLILQRGNQQKGKITSIAFDAMKSSYISLLYNDMRIIEIYRYSTKQLGKKPTFVTYINISSEIHTMYMIQQSQIVLFYQSKMVQIYSIESQNQVKKKYQKFLDTRIQFKKNHFKDLDILCIGEPFMNCITVYLACEQSQTGNNHLFDLYIMEVKLQGQGETTMTKPHRVYSIKKYLKQILKFDNFSKRFFLLYAGLEVIAVMKEGYMIDSAKVDIQKEKSMLKYMGKNRLLLATQTKIQQYEFNLNENSPPYRLHIKSLDSIVLPENYDSNLYEFLDVIPIFQQSNNQKSIYQASQFSSFYLLCFQLKHQKNKKLLTGQVPYLLTMTKTVSVKQKADKIFHFEGRNIETVDLKEIQEKVDIAKKMGLQVKEIYLDLWNRTKKNTVKDFCLLLDTLDYEIISKEIEKKLKKQAMLYTELSKIENSCFYLLKKKVFSPECTETDIKNYIVSHFKLKKYYFFKDVSRFCENQQLVRNQLKLPDKQLSSDSSLKSPQALSVTESQRNEREQKRLMFDIQSFYTYSQMQLKSYLLQLFHKYFYEISESPQYNSKGSKQGDRLRNGVKYPLIWAKKKDYLLKIKIMMNNFRFHLKMIYEQFLQQLIRMTEKGEMLIELLNDFEQILPRSFLGEQIKDEQEEEGIKMQEEEQIRVTKRQQISEIKRSLNKSTHGQLQLQGIWRQVPQAQLQNYLYRQSIQTIYNKQLILSLSKDIWFKRNLYSQHDLIYKTKEEILQIDKKLNSSYIFYFFIDRVYYYIQNQSLRKQVITMIDRNYAAVLPKHIKRKIQLYFQLFLQTKTLSKQYLDTLNKQTKNPINQSAGLRTSAIGLQGQLTLNFFLTQSNKLNPQKSNPNYKKSLYQTFLPPKLTHKQHHLDSFQNFLQLSEIQLFGEFVKLEYILVGCIFHRIKPVYEKFWKGREIFNQTVQKYFESKNSQLSHLKCLLNRLNSQTKEFQIEHFDLYQVLVKSVMCKVQIGSLIPQKQYINVDELIIYIRDIHVVNHSQGLKKLGKRHFGSILQKHDQNHISNNSIISAVKLNSKSSKSIDQDPFLSTPSNYSKIQTFFNILSCVSEYKDLFKNLKIRISLYQIYELHRNNRTEPFTILIVDYFIKKQKLYQLNSYEFFKDKTIEILTQSSIILSKIYSTSESFIKNRMDFQSQQGKDTETNNFQSQLFFIMLWKIMSFEDYLYNGWIFKLLENQEVSNNYKVNGILKENLVIFMCKYRFSIDKLFVNNIKYIECLIQILPDTNRIRKYFASQIEFVKSIEPIHDLQKPEINTESKKVTPKITNPLTQNSQIISIFHIEQIFSLYPSQYLLKLNLERICEIVNDMQEILLEVVVKQRLADRNKRRIVDDSLIQSINERDGLRRRERENSGKFQISMKKSFDLIEDQNNFINGCTSPILPSKLQSSEVVVSEKEIAWFELQTLIRQSARANTFDKGSERQLMKSLKMISQKGSLILQSPNKQQQGEKRSQKQGEEPMNPLQNLSQYYTSLTEIYEIVVKRLINSEMIKQVLGHLQKLLKLSQVKVQKVNHFYVVYPLMIVNIISRELTPENKLLLVKICSHLFKEPLELLKFIKQLIGKRDKSKIDLIQFQSSMTFYSLTDLNQKLIDYQKLTRIYKPQSSSQQKISQSSSQNIPIKTPPIQTKHKLKKTPQKVNPRLSQEISQTDELQYLKRPFSYQNPIIAAHCINQINSDQQKLKFIQHIWDLFETLHKEKELFSKDFEFMIMNVMLFQEPYTIIKYMDIKLKGWYLASREQQLSGQTNIIALSSNPLIKFKSLMSFFNQMIKQQSLNPLRLLQFGKRMFYMLYSTIVERSSIEYKINQYYEIPLTQILPCDEFPESPISQLYTAKFTQSIQAFSKKQKQIKKKITSSGKFIPQLTQSPLQINTKNQSFQLIQKGTTLQQFSSNHFSETPQQDLLQISYNNFEDSLSQNLQTPLITQYPSKISDLSKAEESFDPSKQLELVYSRGQKRLAAMLSNNSSIILKNNISPRNTKSPLGPSISFFSSENSKIKKNKANYFLPNQQSKKSNLKNKRTFDGVMETALNSAGEIMYHHEESVIFQEELQISKNFSQVDNNENFCIEPPKLVNKETDNFFNSICFEENINTKNPVNFPSPKRSPKRKDEMFELKLLQTDSRGQKSNFLKDEPVLSQDQIDKKNHTEKIIKRTKNTKNQQEEDKNHLIARKNANNKKQSLTSKHHQDSVKEAIVIMEEDQSNHFERKSSTGCQFDPNLSKTQKGNKNIESNTPFKRTFDRKVKTINDTSQIARNQQIELKNSQSSKNDSKKSQKSLSPHRKSLPKNHQNKTKFPQNDLSNEVRQFSKSIQQQKPEKITEFIIPQEEEKFPNLERQLNIKNQNKDLKPIIGTKITKKKLTVQIPSDQITPIKVQDHKFLSKTQSQKGPIIINRSQKKIKTLNNLTRQNGANEKYLFIKINQILNKNNIQIFLLTELEDIYEKFKDYWEKCEDIIPSFARRGYQNEIDIGNQASSAFQKRGGSSGNSKNLIRNGQTSSPGPKIGKVKGRGLDSQSDISLQLSHSHQSLEHEQSEIDLLQNQQLANYGFQNILLFTKQELYKLIVTYLTEKIAQMQSQQQQLPESEILLQELKDKLFYDICMKRFLQNFTNQSNVHIIAKIIDKVFAKKILLNDYYYEIITKKQLPKLQSIVEKVAQKATLKTFRYISSDQNQSSIQTSLQMQNKNKQNLTRVDSINKMANLSQRNISSKNNLPRIDNDQDQLQRALQTQMTMLENLLQKIPLNILQYRKKQLMLKLKPGKQLGRKYFLDVLVKVFEKKKDKNVAQEVRLRLKNIIDKNLKM